MISEIAQIQLSLDDDDFPKMMVMVMMPVFVMPMMLFEKWMRRGIRRRRKISSNAGQ
jgi:hypothetical protein